MTVHCIFSELGCGFDDATGNWMLDAVFFVSPVLTKLWRGTTFSQLCFFFSVEEQTNAGEVRESR